MAKSPITPIFEVSQAEGATDSERFLTNLCRRTFLRLWSCSNPYKKPNKELIDVLAVFGSNVILFSDKSCILGKGSDLKQKWSRWARSSIVKSFHQLEQASRWIAAYPLEVYSDVGCSRRLPISIPSGPDLRIYLVATVPSAGKVSETLDGDSVESFEVDNQLMHGWDEASPFSLGWTKVRGSFVHLIDHDSLERIFDELDTITDFLSYLDRRAAALDSAFLVKAESELGMLATFICGGGIESRSLIPEEVLRTSHRGREDLVLLFSERVYYWLLRDPEYLRIKDSWRPSRAWDELIDRLALEGNPLHAGVEPTLETGSKVERGLRVMAEEPRRNREVLYRQLREFFFECSVMPREGTRFRVVRGNAAQSIVYAFFAAKRSDQESSGAFRSRRIDALSVYCLGLMAKFRKIKEVVGIAFDPPENIKFGTSEEICYVHRDDLDEQLRAEALETANRLGILRNESFRPDVEPGVNPVPARRPDSKARKKKGRAERKRRKRSRRNNR